MANVDKFLLRTAFKKPMLGAQLTGTFPLSLNGNKSDFKFKFSFSKIGVAASLVRLSVFVSGGFIINWHGTKLSRMYGGWSTISITAETITHSLVAVGDISGVILLFLRKEKFEIFLNSVANRISHICHHLQPLPNDQDNIDKRLCKFYKNMKRHCCLIIFLGIMGIAPFPFLMYGETLISKPEQALLNINFFFSMQVRLLGFYLPAVLLFVIKIGFIALKCKIKEGLSLNFKKEIVWTLKNYAQLEMLLKEFHYFFQFQLVIGVLSMLIASLDSAFQWVITIMRPLDGANGGLPLWFHPISLVAMALSGILVFCLICDAGTELTTKAQECIWALRSNKFMDALPTALKENVLQFYVEKSTRPLMISPYKAFTLGRHILPTVCFHCFATRTNNFCLKYYSNETL